MGDSIEARRFSRVNFHIKATVKFGSKQFVGNVENLSLRGIFLVTEEKLSVGDVAEIVISLSDDPENGLELEGKVARVTNDGIAFIFDKIDFDTYVHLKRLVEFNIGDPEQMDKEMENLFH